MKTRQRRNYISELKETRQQTAEVGISETKRKRVTEVQDEA